MFHSHGLRGWRRQVRVGRSGPLLSAFLLAVILGSYPCYRNASVPEAGPSPAEKGEALSATEERVPGAPGRAAPDLPSPVAPAGETPVRPAAAAAPSRLQPPGEGRVLTPYGWAFSKILGEWRWHPGVDLAAPEGAPVRAAADGRVAAVRSSREWGWEVVVEHGGGLETRYTGCRAVRVKEGDAVRAGDVLAEVGSGGLLEVESGPHLHFEVVAGGPKDPRTHLR